MCLMNLTSVRRPREWRENNQKGKEGFMIWFDLIPCCLVSQVKNAIQELHHGGSRWQTHPSQQRLQQAGRGEHAGAHEEEGESPAGGEGREDAGFWISQEISETSRQEEDGAAGSVAKGPAPPAGSHGRRSPGTGSSPPHAPKQTTSTLACKVMPYVVVGGGACVAATKGSDLDQNVNQ